MGTQNNKLYFLFNYLNNAKLKKEALLIKNIIKNSYLDYPIEEIDIESKKELFEYLKENPGEFIFLDNPMGTYKKFGGEKKLLPFHYGEFSGIINPADDMGWDVIVISSYKDVVVDGELGHIKSGHNLVPIGYVPVNDSEDEWEKKASKKPPIGNDKIILAPDMKYSDKDIGQIKDFFSSLWQFNDIKLF
tara:strand:- start:1376 stop:1945 length:570 start_codon:yes stop_codon:yes gene_type:complete